MRCKDIRRMEQGKRGHPRHQIVNMMSIFPTLESQPRTNSSKFPRSGDLVVVAGGRRQKSPQKPAPLPEARQNARRPSGGHGRRSALDGLDNSAAQPACRRSRAIKAAARSTPVGWASLIELRTRGWQAISRSSHPSPLRAFEQKRSRSRISSTAA